jgi:hypothetical protein
MGKSGAHLVLSQKVVNIISHSKNALKPNPKDPKGVPKNAINPKNCVIHAKPLAHPPPSTP